ncbi:MAG: BrnT family toxin [Spirochaetaceae bacterium]|nr:BrnT family toxin [Spirochaetaceae bacterium]
MNEDRFIAVGFAGNGILFVSFTEPEPEIVRIISTRKAKEHESEEHYGNY